MPHECLRRCRQTCAPWKNSAALGLWKWIRPQSHRSLRLFLAINLWCSGWFCRWKLLSQNLFQRSCSKKKTHYSRLTHGLLDKKMMELSSFLVNKSLKSFEQRSYHYRVITTEWFARPAPSRWQDLHCWMRSWRWWVWKGKGSARGEPLWKNTNKGGTSENTLHQKTRNQNYTKSIQNFKINPNQAKRVKDCSKRNRKKRADAQIREMNQHPCATI